MERRPTRIRTNLAISVLALTLIAPWALGQDPDPITEIRLAAEQGDAEAQYASSLFQAQSVRCEWGQGTTVSWDGGRPSLEQGSFGNEAGIIFDSIDTQAGTGRIIGNAASGDISVVVTPVGLTFIEQVPSGGLNFTTVFAHFVEPKLP